MSKLTTGTSLAPMPVDEEEGGSEQLRLTDARRAWLATLSMDASNELEAARRRVNAALLLEHHAATLTSEQLAHWAEVEDAHGHSLRQACKSVGLDERQYHLLASRINRYKASLVTPVTKPTALPKPDDQAVLQAQQAQAEITRRDEQITTLWEALRDANASNLDLEQQLTQARAARDEEQDEDEDNAPGPQNDSGHRDGEEAGAASESPRSLYRLPPSAKLGVSEDATGSSDAADKRKAARDAAALAAEPMIRLLRWGKEGGALRLPSGEVVPTPAQLEEAYEPFLALQEFTLQDLQAAWETGDPSDLVTPTEFADQVARSIVLTNERLHDGVWELGTLQDRVSRVDQGWRVGHPSSERPLPAPAVPVAVRKKRRPRRPPDPAGGLPPAATSPATPPAPDPVPDPVPEAAAPAAAAPAAETPAATPPAPPKPASKVQHTRHHRSAPVREAVEAHPEWKDLSARQVAEIIGIKDHKAVLVARQELAEQQDTTAP